MMIRPVAPTGIPFVPPWLREPITLPIMPTPPVANTVITTPIVTLPMPIEGAPR